MTIPDCAGEQERFSPPPEQQRLSFIDTVRHEARSVWAEFASSQNPACEKVSGYLLLKWQIRLPAQELNHV